MFGKMKNNQSSGILSKAIEMVRDFHVAMGQPIAPSLGVPPHDRVKLRAALLIEECLETVGALLNGGRKEQTKELIAQFKNLIESCPDPVVDLVEVADGLPDMIYVIIGCALEFGIPLERVFEAVHRANMAKVGAGVDENGKVKKPDGWTPPNIALILAQEAPN